jgi:hypothetical protein
MIYAYPWSGKQTRHLAAYGLVLPKRGETPHLLSKQLVRISMPQQIFSI